MRIEAYGEPESAERVLRLKLQKSCLEKDCVDLVAVDTKGKRIYCGTLLSITKDGVLMCSTFAEGFLPQDSNGRVRVIPD